MTRSRHTHRSRRARLSIDRLEARDVPAGIVSLSESLGHLVLIGDDFDNSVTVSMTTGANPTVTFTPDSTTTIDDLSVAGGGTMGQEVTVPLKVSFQDLHFTAKGGNDAFLVLDPIGLQMAGALVLDMGNGDNTVQIDTDGQLSLGDLVITAGDGFDRCVIAPRDAASGLATGRRSHKPVIFSLGDGGFDVSMSNFQIPGGGMIFLAGDSTGNGGGGGGGAGGTFTAKGVSMDGGFVSHTGEGLCSFSWGVSQAGSYSGSGKRLAVSCASGTHIKGHVGLSASGDLSLLVDNSKIDGSVKVQKKWLPANFRTQATVELDDSTVDGGVSVFAQGGNSAADLQLVRTAVTGPVSVVNTGPNGSATFTSVDGACGPLSVRATGPGASSAFTSFFGDCIVGACSVRATNQAEANIAGNLLVGTPGVADPTGDISVFSSAGAANLFVNGGGAGGGPHVRNIVVSGFAGADCDSQGQASIRVTGNLIVKSQGHAAIADLDGDGRLDVVGAVFVSGGDSADITTGDSWSSGPVSVFSRMGPVTATFTPTALSITNDFTSAGGDGCAVTVSPTTAGTLAGSVRVKGGSGNDSVLIQDVDGLKDVVLDLGKGDNSATLRKTFVLPHILEVSGRIGITSGSGADNFTLQDCLISGITSIRTGAGTDVVSIDACTFNSAVLIDTGAGDDQVLISQLFNVSQPVTFKGPATIACGLGNDVLSMGIPDDPGIIEDDNSRVVFTQGLSNKIDGGTGINLFDPQASHFDGIDKSNFFNMTDPTP